MDITCRVSHSEKEKSCIFVKIWIIWIYALQISLPFNLAPKIVFLMRKWNLVVGKLVAWETKWLILTYLLTKIKEPRKTSFQTGNSLFVEFQSLLKTPSSLLPGSARTFFLLPVTKWVFPSHHYKVLTLKGLLDCLGFPQYCRVLRLLMIDLTAWSYWWWLDLIELIIV